MNSLVRKPSACAPSRSANLSRRTSTHRNRWALFHGMTDSPLEGAGFEPSVPLRWSVFPNRLFPPLLAAKSCRDRWTQPERDRWFESVFLKRRVHCELDFLERGDQYGGAEESRAELIGHHEATKHAREKGPATAGLERRQPSPATAPG